MSDPKKPLPSAKHETFARHLAEGKTADAAYKAAGFKPNRGNASTLKANQNIEARVAFLRSKTAEKVAERGFVNTLDLFHDMLDTIAKAKAAGEHAVALKGYEVVMKMFGYVDQPTLAQEHLANHRRQEAAPDQGAAAPSQGQGITDNILQLHKPLAALKKA